MNIDHEYNYAQPEVRNLTIFQLRDGDNTSASMLLYVSRCGGHLLHFVWSLVLQPELGHVSKQMLHFLDSIVLR